MSGPIVRKYGFPNFEKIFGERPLKHGEEGPETQDATKKEPANSAPETGTPKPDPSETPRR